MEIAWSAHPHWVSSVQELSQRCAGLELGAASVVDRSGLDAAAAAGLAYAVSPVLEHALVERAHQLKLAFVPGVMSPTEVHQARLWGCSLVKLFPAAPLGCSYWQRLAGPLAGPQGLPHCIAAGGLGPNDVEAWLADEIAREFAVAEGAAFKTVKVEPPPSRQKGIMVKDVAELVGVLKQKGLI